MGCVDAVFGGKSPVALDQILLAVWEYRQVFIEEAGLQVQGQRVGRCIADEGKHNVLALLHRIGLQRDLSDQRALGISDDCDQRAVAYVVSKAVIPAADRVLGVAFRSHRERNSAMCTPIFDGVDAAVDALEQDPLTEQLLAAALTLRQLSAEEWRVPVIAKAEFSLEVRTPTPCRRSATIARTRGLVRRW